MLIKFYKECIKMKDGDYLIVELDNFDDLDFSQVNTYLKSLKEQFPKNPIIFIPPGMTIRIIPKKDYETGEFF